jgi:hypothetical protein
MSVEDYEARDKALEIALLVPHGTLYSLDHRRCIERAICDEFQKYSREIATLKAELEAARKEIERLNIAMNRWSEMELIEDIDIDELEKSLPATMIVPTAHYKVVCNILINKIRQLAAERDATPPAGRASGGASAGVGKRDSDTDKA